MPRKDTSKAQDATQAELPNRRVDLRVLKTREAIRNAFREMVCEMDADQITVTGVAKKARIHRKTFYLHYTSIEALFEDMMQELAKSYRETIDKVDGPLSTEDINRVFFENLAGQELFYERLLNTPSYREFAGKLFLVNLRHNRERYNPYAHLSQAEQDIVNTFLVFSTLDMYRAWVRGGKEVPLEDMIELSSKLLSHGSQAVIDGQGPAR